MSETYQFKDKQLIICDPDLGINIEESFKPLIIPKDHASTKGLVVKKDDSGQVLRAYFEIEGKFEGQYQLYYPGGSVESECYYFEGKLHGPSRFFSENGDCISETWFYRDRKEGKSTRYYLSGKLCSIERFREGVHHGKQEYYYEDGALKSIIHYQGGTLEGDVVLFWPNGKKKRECSFVYGLREGNDRMWSSQGKLIDEGKYDKGNPVGLHSRFYENGTPQEERLYHTPLRFDRTEWDPDGKMILQGRFDASLSYEEKRWIQGSEEIRKGVWKEGRIFWGEDAD